MTIIMFDKILLILFCIDCVRVTEPPRFSCEFYRHFCWHFSDFVVGGWFRIFRASFVRIYWYGCNRVIRGVCWSEFYQFVIFSTDRNFDQRRLLKTSFADGQWCCDGESYKNNGLKSVYKKSPGWHSRGNGNNRRNLQGNTRLSALLVCVCVSRYNN